MPQEHRFNFDIGNFLGYYLDRADLAEPTELGFSPIVSRPIGSMNQRNIVIQGKTGTDFEPNISGDENNGIAYITVRRPKDGLQRVFDGYGIAWRPANYADGPSGPNLFIVDNSDVIFEPIRTINEWITGSNYRNHVKATAITINPNTEYHYRIIIDEDNAMTVWFSTDENDLGDISKIAIRCGARRPITYNPSREISFGVSVKNSCGCVWTHHNIYISTYRAKYPGILCDMDVSDMPEQYACRYNAVGTSPVGASGVRLYAYNHLRSRWDMISQNLVVDMEGAPDITTMNLKKSIYASANNRAHFVVLTSNPSGDTDQVATLELKHFSLYPPPTKQISLGGAVDIYIDDDSLETKTKVIPAGTITERTYVPDFEDDVPVWITSVTVGGVNQIHNTDYVWGYKTRDYAGSIKQNIYFRFIEVPSPGDEVAITYLNSPAVTSVGDINDDYHRSFKGSDILVKHMPVHYLTYDAEAVESAELITGIRSYIDQLSVDEEKYKTIEYLDLITYLRMQGILPRSLTITIQYKEGLMLNSQVLSAQGDTYRLYEIHTIEVGSA